MAEGVGRMEADRTALASVTVLEMGERVGASVCSSLLRSSNIIAERILGLPPELRVDKAAPFKR